MDHQSDDDGYFSASDIDTESDSNVDVGSGSDGDSEGLVQAVHKAGSDCSCATSHGLHGELPTTSIDGLQESGPPDAGPKGDEAEASEMQEEANAVVERQDSGCRGLEIPSTFQVQYYMNGRAFPPFSVFDTEP